MRQHNGGFTVFIKKKIRASEQGGRQSHTASAFSHSLFREHHCSSSPYQSRRIWGTGRLLSSLADQTSKRSPRSSTQTTYGSGSLTGLSIQPSNALRLDTRDFSREGVETRSDSLLLIPVDMSWAVQRLQRLSKSIPLQRVLAFCSRTNFRGRSFL